MNEPICKWLLDPYQTQNTVFKTDFVCFKNICKKPYPQVQEGSSELLVAQEKEQFSLYLETLSKNLMNFDHISLRRLFPLFFFSIFCLFWLLQLGLFLCYFLCSTFFLCPLILL